VADAGDHRFERYQNDIDDWKRNETFLATHLR